MNEAATQAITLTIDSTEISVAPGTSILQAARSAGIYIPTLCYLECLPDYGGCRLCMVEVQGMRGTPTACTTPVASGMQVSTVTPELQQLRREILELILSEHPYTCLVCADKGACSKYMHSTRKVSTVTGCNFCPCNGDCELQQLVGYLELEEVGFPIAYRNLAPVLDNPFYTIDYNLCILCGRCVRICNEERYSEVIQFVSRGNDALVGTVFGESQKEAGCEFCGACVDVCPTGALMEKLGRWVGRSNRSTETHCVFCSTSCRMTVNTMGNRIVNIGPQTGKRDNPPQLCIRGKFVFGDISHHPERVTKPHIKKQGQWAEASWQEALELIGDNLEKGSGFGLIGSGHDTMENSFSLQQFARQAMGSPNVDLSPPFSTPEVIKDIHDYGLAHGHAGLDDILLADRVYVIGAQTHWSHPMVENRVRKAFRAGREVVVAHSAPIRTAEFSSTFHLYEGGSEHIFLYELVEKIGSSKDDQQRVLIVGDEVLRSSRSRENVDNLINLAASSEGRTRLMFLLPEGNRYGGVLAGMNPALAPGFVAAEQMGLTAEKMLETPKAISSLLVVGDVPEGPALAELSFFVQLNMFFTPASRHAHVFLPMAVAMETEGHILSQEGKLKALSPAIAEDTYIHSTGRLVEELAGAVGASRMIDTQTAISQKISDLVDKPMAGGGDLKSRQKVVPASGSRSENGRLTRERLLYHHFHYMGNSLPARMVDLRRVLE